MFLTNYLSVAGYLITAVDNSETAFKMLNKDNYHVALLDITMPQINVIDILNLIKEKQVQSEIITLTNNTTIKDAVKYLKLGAFGYMRRLCSLFELIACIERAMEQYNSKINVKFLKSELEKSGADSTLIGTSKAMSDLRSILGRIAPTDSNVLISGGSGSGKEVVARTIHNQSPRAEKPFVPVNCASFSAGLLESELFGYEKGAFTDAKTQKIGLAEMGNGGTLFLDEIGEIPFHLQAKLLRFLETGDIRRVGGTKNIYLNVRIICATNQPLEKLVMEKKFREDLFYRLNVLSVFVPSLRERVDDIPLLVNHFIKRHGCQKQFDKSAIDTLKAYRWPGNIRELRNVVERTCILTQDRMVSGKDLSFLKVNSKPAGETETMDGISNNFDVAGAPGFSQSLLMKDVERRLILHVLGSVNGHKANAAKILGICQKTLYLKMRTYDITSVYG
jgi:DNA-binding NtrC family response regulator